MSHGIADRELHDLAAEGAGTGYDYILVCGCGERHLGWGISESNAEFAASLRHEGHVRQATFDFTVIGTYQRYQRLGGALSYREWFPTTNALLQVMTDAAMWQMGNGGSPEESPMWSEICRLREALRLPESVGVAA